MKKIVTLAVIATAMLTACNGEKLRDAEAQNEQLKGDLRETLATQDSLLGSVANALRNLKRNWLPAVRIQL